jgi:excisionase family DNA binding protein/PAS domain S-box-containing protein
VLTTGEAARLLGVTSQTVINWMESGRLPFLRVERGRRKVRAADLRALIESAGIPAHRLDPDLWTRVVDSCRVGRSDPRPLLVLDSAMTVLFWSPSGVEKFGWTSAEVEGRPVSGIPARVPGLPVDLADLAQPARGETFRTLLLEIGTKSGGWMPTEIAVSWIHDAQGEPCGSAFVLQEPTGSAESKLPRRGRPPRNKGAR